MSQVAQPVYAVDIPVAQHQKSESPAPSLSDSYPNTSYRKSPESIIIPTTFLAPVEAFDFGLEGSAADAIQVKRSPTCSVDSNPTVTSVKSARTVTTIEYTRTLSRRVIQNPAVTHPPIGAIGDVVGGEKVKALQSSRFVVLYHKGKVYSYLRPPDIKGGQIMYKANASL